MYEHTVKRTIDQLVGKKKKEDVELIHLPRGQWGPNGEKITYSRDLNELKKPRTATLNNDYSLFMDNGVESDRTFNRYCDKMRALQVYRLNCTIISYVKHYLPCLIELDF